MGAIENNIQALVNQVGSACQVVAICGRNKGLIKRLQAKQYPAGMQVGHTCTYQKGACTAHWMACITERADLVFTSLTCAVVTDVFTCQVCALLRLCKSCLYNASPPSFCLLLHAMSAVAPSFLSGRVYNQLVMVNPRVHCGCCGLLHQLLSCGTVTLTGSLDCCGFNA